MWSELRQTRGSGIPTFLALPCGVWSCVIQVKGVFVGRAPAGQSFSFLTLSLQVPIDPRQNGCVDLPLPRSLL